MSKSVYVNGLCCEGATAGIKEPSGVQPVKK
jgi:hypothetical protein